MKLTYRGVAYDYNPPTLAVTNTELVGKYRGLDWRFRNLEKPPVLQPTVSLTYRGVAYGNTSETATATTPETVTATDRARSRMVGQTLAIKKREQSMLKRLASQVGLDGASEYFNHIQGKIHPSFRRTYQPSRVALS